MFISSISGVVTDLTPNNQTRFQCTVTLTIPHEEVDAIEPGRLIAAENIFHAARDKRYTIMQIVDFFPVPEEKKSAKKSSVNLICSATPIGQELRYKNAKTGPEIVEDDTFPAFDGGVQVLDDDMTRTIIHHIAPESRLVENGSRVDIGSYRSNPAVKVGLDSAALLRGNAAIISARPRARTTIANNLIQSLLQHAETPVHIVYCDVNNLGTLSLAPQLSSFPHSSILCLNDKFVPPSVFSAMRNLGDRSAHKRAVLDYLDMMILPSVLEPRRHDFSYPISTWMRENRITIFRPNEQTVDQFITEISVDILDGIDEEVEEYIAELMNGIAETYRGERFSEKNTKDMLDMIDDFSQESKSHSARRTLYDLKAEIQSVFETYSKDIPPATRKSTQDIVNQLNNDDHSSLLVVQGQKTTDILRFIGNLSQTLIDERLKRLKIRTPVLFIFNNIDEYVTTRTSTGFREGGSDRFNDTLQTLLTNGRRHGLGFCLTLENAQSLDQQLARKIQTYLIGPITFADEPAGIANLLNLSEDLLQPAVRYEDGDFLFTASDSPYHRRVPLPVVTQKSSETIHLYLDEMKVEQERRRQEYMAQEEERRKRQEQEREERRKREEKEREERRKREEKEQAERKKREAEKSAVEEAREEDAAAEEQAEETASRDDRTAEEKAEDDRSTTRSRRRRGGKRTRSGAKDDGSASDKESGAAEKDAKAGDSSSEHSGADEKAEKAPDAEGKGNDTDDSAGEEKPARKTTRGRRGGRGRKPARKDETASDDNASVKDDAKESTPKPSVPTGASTGASTASSLTIEEFDPDAGKSSSKKAANESDGSDKTDADGDDGKKAPAKKAPRRSTRRGPRTRKSPPKASGSKGEE